MTNQNVSGNNNNVAQGDINITTEQLIHKIPMTLSKVVPELVKISDNDPKNKSKVATDAYEIDAKLNHNKVVVFRDLIESYGEYGNKIDAVYESAHGSIPNAKKKIMDHLHQCYLDAKTQILSKYLGDDKSKENILNTIQNYSDEIISLVINRIISELRNSEIKNVPLEDLTAASQVAVCHGFINCKILERVK